MKSWKNKSYLQTNVLRDRVPELTRLDVNKGQLSVDVVKSIFLGQTIARTGCVFHKQSLQNVYNGVSNMNTGI